jgi:mannose-6-phosphate isomerase-like protein (cupin superfamily)
MKIANVNDVEARKFEGRDNYFILNPEDGGAKNMLIGYTIVWPRCETKPAHSHEEMEEVYFVTKGKGAIIIDGEERGVSAGDVIYIPFGSTHLAKNTGTSPFEYLWVISPPILPDFLKKKPT